MYRHTSSDFRLETGARRPAHKHSSARKLAGAPQDPESSALRRIRAAASRGCPQNASEMKPPLVLLLAAATADDDVLLKQLTRALGKPATPRALADVFIDDRFEYLRDEADYTFEAGDADKVVEAFSRRITPNVPVIDLQATFENCSALCAFWTSACQRTSRPTSF